MTSPLISMSKIDLRYEHNHSANTTHILRHHRIWKCHQLQYRTPRSLLDVSIHIFILTSTEQFVAVYGEEENHFWMSVHRCDRDA